LPTIRIEEPVDLLGFGELVQDCHTYDWIVFTSPNGVDAFFKMFDKLYNDARSIGGVRIACIGPGTAEKSQGPSPRRRSDAGKELRRRRVRQSLQRLPEHGERQKSSGSAPKKRASHRQRAHRHGCHRR
jgi:hypothetical protein